MIEVLVEKSRTFDFKGNILLTSLGRIQREVRGLINNRATRAWLMMLVLKVIILLLTAVVGFSQFANSTPGQALSDWQVYGRVGSAALFVVALLVLFADGDAGSELRAANRALDVAEDLEKLRPRLEAWDQYATRTAHLFLALKVIRNVQEQSLNYKVDDEIIPIETLFQLTKFYLPVAINFPRADQWTICVYKAHRNDGKPDTLKCIAHNRAIECELRNAREWAEGVGVAGISYANRREVIVPDLRAGNLGNLFNVGSKERDYDHSRYRSFAVVPVSLGSEEKPWGVVVATSSKPYHFNLETGPGITTAEAIRTLADAIALTVVCCRSVASAASLGNPGGASSIHGG